ncbi:MAG: ThuA domain-containing protein [Planctomycetaceae bacterium]
MKTIAATLGSCILCCLIPVTAFGQAAEDGGKQWVTYEGNEGPGKGKHIVFVAGDDEYRSEEALPQLAKIAAVRHGFKCTVLFPINPETSEIQPTYQKSVPGTEALDSADLMVIATRFRDLPDEQMVPIDNYLKRGGPVVGLRTATHAFNIKDKDSKWSHYSWRYNGEKKEWAQGFGRLVLGETWINHHGRHKDESARGIVAESAKDHPIARGLKGTDIWGPSDVYGIRLNKLPETFEPIVLGNVIKRPGKRKNEAFYGMKPSDIEVNKEKSDPAMPIAWTKSYMVPGGKKGRSFTTTMGAATDIVSDGTRRMIFNGMLWAMGMDKDIPDGGANVEMVGEYKPTKFGFGDFKKGLRVSDFEMKEAKK